LNPTLGDLREIGSTLTRRSLKALLRHPEKEERGRMHAEETEKQRQSERGIERERERERK